MKNNYLIIGVGSIGFRHFQSLNKFENINIHFLDPKIKFIKKKIEKELKKNNKYFFYSKISLILKKQFQLVIVATNSNIRFEIFNYIIKNKITKNILLEKVLFSNLLDYKKYKEILDKYKFNCWVNCLNRVFSISKKIKKDNKGNKLRKLSVLGNDWGIGCNFIHFLDLASFLTNCFKIKSVKVSIKNIFKSKRKGFLEFYGEIKILFSNLTEVILKSRKGKLGYKLNLFYFKKKYQINELTNKIKIQNNQKTLKYFYKTPRVSDLTFLYVKKIIANKNPGLPTLKNSLEMHYSIISAICREFSVKNKSIVTDCRIT